MQGKHTMGLLLHCIIVFTPYYSIWIHQLQYAFKAHLQAGENPELRTWCYKLHRLLEIPAHVLFVFDGPHRPSRKRNVKVRPVPAKLMGAFRDLIEAYGFQWHVVSPICILFMTLVCSPLLSQAPCEAEAELALLNCQGYIDVILTEDSDAFVFGARSVIREYVRHLHPSNGKKTNDFCSSTYTDNKGWCDMYTADRIQTTDTVRLTQGGLLLLALFCGGDYDKVCGIFIPACLCLLLYTNVAVSGTCWVRYRHRVWFSAVRLR